MPIIPLSDNDITNPDRGLYRWNGNEMAPFPSIDRYARYNWTVFETAQGVYNFTTLKNEAAAAYSDPDGRGTFGLAFRCVVEGTDHAYPAYLDAKMTSWYSAVKKCWMPDWNNAFFLERHDSLVANLGREFNNDPRIGYVEIRTYGNWGEWHLSGFETPPSPLTGITSATIQHIIDVFVKAFPDKQLIMMSDNEIGLEYAMKKTGLKYPIGWRRDSWCNSGMRTPTTSSRYATAWPAAQNRWKTAPVIIEAYGNTGMTYSYGLQQVIDFHISGIGNGNFGTNASWSTLTTDAKDAMVNSSKTAGYRYILRDVTTETVFVPGKTVRFVSNWSNVGVAPAYRNWQIRYRLIHPTTSALVWESPSKLILRSLLPTYNFATSIDTPVNVDESFTLPLNIEPGTYALEVLITDSDNYFNPLKLANLNRKTNGAYPIGNITVDTQNAIKKVSELSSVSLSTFTGNTIRLTVETPGKYSLTLHDTIGRCIFSAKELLNKGMNSVETPTVTKGIYILNIACSGKSKTLKIIKQ
ncbi:MAG: DUF4832 domain-containing protein [Bacteroidia bacterium]|nr:DUF4832 domain-containing protein [Bacteroidia bacterium]